MGSRSKDVLIVLTGPTAVGKTGLAIGLAEALGCEIISADSRQVYREMSIGTAAPTEAEMSRVPHHLVRCRSVAQPMNAFDYEQAVMSLLPDAFARGGGRAILTGGSMMYVDAVVRGIDEMPDVPTALRDQLKDELERKGLTAMQERLRSLDPAYFASCDIRNPRRVLHAIELCIVSGGPVSALRRGTTKERPFDVIKVAAMRSREELYERIDKRVDMMMSAGLEDEVRSLTKFSSLTPLNTVGYREMFAYLRGEYDKYEAVRLIKRNTRHYAKKQLTWIKADGGYTEVSPDDLAGSREKISQILESGFGNTDTSI